MKSVALCLPLLLAVLVAGAAHAIAADARRRNCMCADCIRARGGAPVKLFHLVVPRIPK